MKNTNLLAPQRKTGSPKTLSNQLQKIKKADALSQLKKYIKIDSTNLSQIFTQKFSQDNKDDVVILESFCKDFGIELVKGFMIYMLLQDNVNEENKESMLEELKEETKFNYRMLLGGLVGRVKDYLKILIMLSYFVFYLLLFQELKEQAANHPDFLVFCFEVVHTELNGADVSSNSLKKIILRRFQNNYRVPVGRLSVISKLTFDYARRKSSVVNPNMKSPVGNTMYFEATRFREDIKSRSTDISQAYKDLIHRFREDFEKYKQQKDRCFEAQHKRFKEAKAKVLHKSDLQLYNGIFKDRFDVNRMSQALRDNTPNPKKKHFIRKLSRTQ